jgi:hypothetical protein
MSISSYLILHRRGLSHAGKSRHARAATPREPLRSRWYVPWLVAAVALAGLIVAAIAALEIVTATARPSAAPQTRPATAERGFDVELTGAER